MCTHTYVSTYFVFSALPRASIDVIFGNQRFFVDGLIVFSVDNKMDRESGNNSGKGRGRGRGKNKAKNSGNTEQPQVF